MVTTTAPQGDRASGVAHRGDAPAVRVDTRGVERQELDPLQGCRPGLGERQPIAIDLRRIAQQGATLDRGMDAGFEMQDVVMVQPFHGDVTVADGQIAFQTEYVSRIENRQNRVEDVEHRIDARRRVHLRHEVEQQVATFHRQLILGRVFQIIFQTRPVPWKVQPDPGGCGSSTATFSRSWLST
jgi:hypothetical protein